MTKSRMIDVYVETIGEGAPVYRGQAERGKNYGVVAHKLGLRRRLINGRIQVRIGSEELLLTVLPDKA